MTILKAFAAASLLAGATTASAATWNFDYSFDGNSFSGTITGDLQADNNTIFVTGVSNTVLNGMSVGPYSNITSLGAFFAPPGNTPAVTLDGSYMELAVCSALPACLFGFTFDTTPAAAIYSVPKVFVFNYPGTGGQSSEFFAQNWSIGSAVPEPASWALLIAGFGLAGAVLRRRRLAYAA